MTDREREPDWQILQSEDLAFLQRIRGETQALLDTSQRWTELMKSIVATIPREKQEGREKFGQDVLGKKLLKGVPTEGVDAMLADTKSQQRLETLLGKIDGKIAVLIQEQSSAGEPPAQQQKPAA